MKKLFILVLMCCAISLTGCLKVLDKVADDSPSSSQESPSSSQEDTENVEQLLDDSYEFFENGLVEDGLQAMHTVLDIDPQHATANFVVAILDIIDLVNDSEFKLWFKKEFNYVPPSLDQMFDRSTYTNSMSAASIQSSASSSASASTQAGIATMLHSMAKPNNQDVKSQASVALPINASALLPVRSVNELQATDLDTGITTIEMVEFTFLPRIHKAVERLGIIINNSSFEAFDLQSINPDTDQLEIDRGDLYIFRSFFSTFSWLIHTTLIYDFTMDVNTLWTAESLGAFLQQNPAFGTLRDGAHLEKSFDYLKLTMESLLDGLAYIEAETDDQSDDLMRLEPTEYLLYGILSIGQANLDDLEAALAGPVLTGITIGETTIETTIDLAAFIDNPIEDIRDIIPTSALTTTEPETYELTADKFPDDYDFTYNGLFPDLDTYDKWVTLLGSIPIEAISDFDLEGYL